MAVTTTSRIAGPFVGNGVTTVFPFAFKVFAATDLSVLCLAGTDTPTELTLGADYSVSLNANQDTAPGGSVTLVSALPSSSRMVVASSVEALQEVVLTNLGGFFPTVLNTVFDRLTILAQQVQQDADRSLKFGLLDDTSSVELPSAVGRASTFLTFDAAGSATVTSLTEVGKSAYQSWLGQGNAGNEAAFVASLQGAKGDAAVVTSNGVNGGFTVPGKLNQPASFSHLATTPNSQVPYVEQQDQFMTIDGPGFSHGNYGLWSASSNFQATLFGYTRGINHTVTAYNNVMAEGDKAAIYAYINSVGGLTAPSDEGCTGINVEVMEFDAHLKATISTTTGNGDQAPTLKVNAGSPNWLTDGGILMNISKGTISGTLTGNFVPVNVDGTAGAGGTQAGWKRPTAGNGLNAFPVSLATGSAPLPVSSAWGHVASNALWPNDTTGSKMVIPDTGFPSTNRAAIQVQVTLLPVGGVVKPFKVGHPIWIAGYNRSEQSVITYASAVNDSTQTIGFSYAYMQPEAYIFQDGLVGQYISMDAELPFSGLRSSWRAFASLDGTHLITHYNAEGSPTPLNFVSGLSASRCNGSASAAFHLYPGAENIANINIAQTVAINQPPVPTLEQNSVTWAVGDQVECTMPSFFGGHCGWFPKWQYTQCLPGFGSSGIEIDLQGTGVGPESVALQMVNGSAGTQYLDQGGPLVRPVAIDVQGPWQNLIYLHQPTAAPMLRVGDYVKFTANAVSGSTQITVQGVFDLDPVNSAYIANNHVGRPIRFDGVFPAGTVIEAIAGATWTLSAPATASTPDGGGTLIVPSWIYADENNVKLFSYPDGSLHTDSISANYMTPQNLMLKGAHFVADDDTTVSVGNFVMRAYGPYQGTSVPTVPAGDVKGNPDGNGNNGTGSSIASCAYVDRAVKNGSAQAYSGSLQVSVPGGTKTLTITNGLITAVA